MKRLALFLIAGRRALGGEEEAGRAAGLARSIATSRRPRRVPPKRPSPPRAPSGSPAPVSPMPRATFAPASSTTCSPIVVAEQASAVTSGTTKTQRTSSAKNTVTALAGRHQSRRPARQPGGPLRRYPARRTGHHQPGHYA